MEQVEAGVEELVSCAHDEKYRFVGVVDPHDGVAGAVDKLVVGALEERRVQVDPVARDVDRHRHLEEKHPPGVERAQRGQQAHRGAPAKKLLPPCQIFNTVIFVKLSRLNHKSWVKN